MSGLLQRGRPSSSAQPTTDVTVPPMDGALKPNRLLDEAQIVARSRRPDNLARDGDRLLFSAGAVLNALRVDPCGGDPVEVERFDGDIAAVACDDAGGYAVALDGGEILLRGAIGGLPPIRPKTPLAPTALAFGPHGQLYVCSGSATNRPSAWKRDLVERNASGSLWRFDIASGQGVLLGRDLAFPYGIAFAGDDALLVSESWRHRLLLLPTGGPRGGDHIVVLDDLPGYPARIAPAADGYWLTIFAPRGQLIEFVLREREYRQRMAATVDPDFWMAPALSSGRSFLEPLQLGAIRTMGALKPWAPTRSYGLLVHLDDRYRPTGSAHSRADGNRHGVTSCLQWGERTFAASKGGDLILSIDTARFA